MLATPCVYRCKRLFLSYHLFVSLLCQEMEGGLNGSSGYLVMDVVHNCLRLLRHESLLCGPGTSLLALLCRAALPSSSQVVQSLVTATVVGNVQVVGEYLPVIVYVLLQYARCGAEEEVNKAASGELLFCCLFPCRQ